MKKRTTEEWDFIMTDSEYNIARTLLETYRAGDSEQLGLALERFFESSKRNAELELLNTLQALMEAILLWKAEIQFRTQERREYIYQQQQEIEMLMEFNACLTNDSINNEWQEAFDWAKELAEVESNNIQDIEELTWEEVFSDKY